MSGMKKRFACDGIDWSKDFWRWEFKSRGNYLNN